MKIKHKSVEIPTDGTDAFVNCKLDRRKYAEVLTSIVSTYSNGFVLAINNKWGTGKTTFVKMWQQHLINQGFQTLYFNAWENDFQPEVMVALLSELSELRNKSENTFQNVLEKASKFLTKATPALTKGVASKFVGEEAVSDVIAAAAEFTTEELDKKIKSFNEAQKGIIDFRDSLRKFVARVDNDKPIIFIIDELDRCRPNYAVSVLEEVKHLFSVSGIVFVISIDKKQLGHAVRGVYGSDLIDADEYLKRFIDLEYKIPKANKQDFIEYLLQYFDYNKFLLSPERKDTIAFKYDLNNFKTISFVLFESDNFSLRSLERILGRIRLTINSFTNQQFVFPEIILLLAYLYEKHPKVYVKIENSEYGVQEVVNVMDDILFPFQENDYQVSITYLYASFLWRYNNQYMNLNYRDATQIIKSDDAGNFKLVFDSKLEDRNNNLLKSILKCENKFETSDIELSHIQKKYSLMESVRI
ncbi:KAP family P-loop NTPase fold protein [Altibacter sp. HG106]|uniref:KAP family P-loop NTPase fold protein n=1 Tax=Altibacter sp. HG106 TaxID=3023937 RepID=UPI00234FF0CC|nr:P-loop NTPase fold protein [Altibacter sp. HG106]MDC7995626.1 P-loop NTPase fold protein [Altibacter sp. HG106]